MGSPLLPAPGLSTNLTALNSASSGGSFPDTLTFEIMQTGLSYPAGTLSAILAVDSLLNTAPGGGMTPGPVTLTAKAGANQVSNPFSMTGTLPSDALTADIINSTFCGTNVGHDIKSRALTTTVTGSTMYVGAVDPSIPACANNPGSTSAGVDLPNGGVGVLENDTIIQGTANSNGALVIYGGESPFNTPASLAISGTMFEGDGSKSSIGVNEIGGCLAPVQGSGNTVTPGSLGTDISPAGCGSLGTVSAVDEPSPFWLLLTALGGAGWLAAARRRSGRAIKG